MFYYQNQISIVIPLLTSLTDPLKNKMKEEKYKAFMTKLQFLYSYINSYFKPKRKSADGKDHDV